MGEPTKICASCGQQGPVRIQHRGSMIILFVGLLFFIVPGLFYLLYMLTGSYHTCRSCGSRDVIALDTPRGRELAARYGP